LRGNLVGDIEKDLSDSGSDSEGSNNEKAKKNQHNIEDNDDDEEADVTEKKGFANNAKQS